MTGDTISWVGRPGDEAPAAEREVDLGGRLVLPGFADAHTHLLMMGAALGQVYLTEARSVDDIRALLLEARAADP
ncbi:amidohydrolase family protein, partial [Priestia sp. SIMBA_032]|uniref:amidohydrolase family protein n=1 Tax=Priestia sp. SIMBA_032 TaxID=3085775 RepID=UPI00397DAE4A